MHLNLTESGGAGEGAEAPTLRIGEVVAGKYRLDHLLGIGGMAEVYAATNLQTEKHVALKWVLPRLASSEEGRTRLLREAQAAGRIHHPNVVTIFDVVEHQGSVCLVMELLEGETLASRMARSGQLPFVEAVALILPAMRGVAAAHENGVIHRDLKPDNIFICLDANQLVRECKVLDFGVSKLAASDTSGMTDITLAGNLVGTPTYMSPEQVRGSRTFDARVDVYALGVVLYEMLAGHPPFVGETYSAVMIDVATSDAPPLASIRKDVPKHLAQVIHRALERDLRLRFPDVPTFIHELEEAARHDLHLSLGTPPEGLITQISLARAVEGSGRVWAAGHRSRVRWLAVAIAAGAALGLFGVWRWQHRRTAAPAEVLAAPTLPAEAPAAGSSAEDRGQPGQAGRADEASSPWSTPESAAPSAQEKSPPPGKAGPGSADGTVSGAMPASGPRRAAGRARSERVERAEKNGQPAGALDQATGTATPASSPSSQQGVRRPRAGKLSVDDF